MLPEKFSGPGIRLVVLMVLVMVSGRTWAQKSGSPLPSRLLGQEINPTRNQSFSGQNLWAYMNGGADLYLEYGCRNLQVLEFNWNQSSWKAEIFSMANPKAAWGIFSITRNKCLHSDTIPLQVCLHPNHAGVFTGNYYLSISCFDKNPGGHTKELVALARSIFGFSASDEPSLPDWFAKKDFEPYRWNSQFMNGTLGVKNGAPDQEDYFESLNDFNLYTLVVNPEGVPISLIYLETADEAGVQDFCTRSGFPAPLSEGTLVKKSAESEEKWTIRISPTAILFANVPPSEASSQWLEHLITPQ